MNYKVTNPKEDMHGNKRENIFIAKDEKGVYVAHSYVWAYENHHSSYAKPRNIFIMIDTPLKLGAEVNNIRQMLFDNALKRAYEIKDTQWKNETVRIYGGAFAYEKDKIDFFIKQGFIDDDSALIMKHDLKRIAETDPGWEIKINFLDTELEQISFIERHNLIFPNEINLEKLNNLKKQNEWKLYGIYKSQRLLGECFVFEKNRAGYIEMFYVTSEARGKGASDTLMDYVLKQFKNSGYKEAKLGVWQRNDRALRFYERHGFILTGEREEVFPGIDV